MKLAELVRPRRVRRRARHTAASLRTSEIDHGTTLVDTDDGGKGSTGSLVVEIVAASI